MLSAAFMPASQAFKPLRELAVMPSFWSKIPVVSRPGFCFITGGGFVGQQCLALPFLFFSFCFPLLLGSQVLDVKHTINRPFLAVTLVKALSHIAHIKR